MKKRFYFKIEAAGVGETEEEAWQDIVTNFHQDPGFHHEVIDEEVLEGEVKRAQV